MSQEHDGSDSVIKRIQGSLLGFACGDALGATTEFMTPEEIREEIGVLRDITGGGWLDLEPGEVTDDTQMMTCVARSLAASNGIPDYRDMADRLLAWLDSGPKDVGSACRKGLESYRAAGRLGNGDNETLGNGGVLRVLPFALAGLSWQDAVRHSELTHGGSVYVRHVQSYITAVSAALSGCDKREVTNQFRGLKPRPYLIENGGDVGNTLRSVKVHFHVTDSFEECVIRAANAGGDADSVAALAGGLAGAYYGVQAIPAGWLEMLDRDVHDELLHLAEQLLVLRG